MPVTGKRLTAREFNLEILTKMGMGKSVGAHPCVAQPDSPYSNYFDGRDALVLSTCTDSEGSMDVYGREALDVDDLRLEFESTVPTIVNALQLASNREAIQTAIKDGKNIIIPVIEYQSSPINPRQHYVTLHYDPTTNVASLIDSRPQSISMWYRTGSMEAMLKEGLSGLLDPQGQRIDVNKLKFDTVYQAVQNNDTYCGYWTAQNIADLVGVDLDNPNNVVCSSTPLIQKNKYRSQDEMELVGRVINFAQGIIQETDVDDQDVTTGGYISFNRLLARQPGVSPLVSPAQQPNDDEDNYFFPDDDLALVGMQPDFQSSQIMLSAEQFEVEFLQYLKETLPQDRTVSLSRLSFFKPKTGFAEFLTRQLTEESTQQISQGLSGYMSTLGSKNQLSADSLFKIGHLFEAILEKKSSKTNGQIIHGVVEIVSKSCFNRPLQKLAEESVLRGESERRTGVYTLVHEDSSTASTKQDASSVEFPKRSNDDRVAVEDDSFELV